MRKKGRACGHQTTPFRAKGPPDEHSISGLVVEYIVAIDVTRVRFPADASISFSFSRLLVGIARACRYEVIRFRFRQLAAWSSGMILA